MDTKALSIEQLNALLTPENKEAATMQPENVQQAKAPDQIINELISGIMELTYDERKELLGMWKGRKKIPTTSLASPEAKKCAHMLRGLVSCCERMTVGNYLELPL